MRTTSKIAFLQRKRRGRNGTGTVREGRCKKIKTNCLKADTMRQNLAVTGRALSHSCAVKRRAEGRYVLQTCKVSCPRNDFQITEKRKEGGAMGLFAAGTITGVLLCAMAELVRCVLWFEIMHPEDDYWHRSALRPISMEEAKDLNETGESSRNALHPAGDV